MNKNGVTRAQVQHMPLMRETPMKRILGRFIRWPRVESPGQITSPSGWVTKEDPLKEKKNQLERDRRGEVATVTVLERTRDYCLFLQQQVGEEFHILDFGKMIDYYSEAKYYR